MKTEVNDRLENAVKLFYSLNNEENQREDHVVGKRQISSNTNLTMFETIFKSILLHGSES